MGSPILYYPTAQCPLGNGYPVPQQLKGSVSWTRNVPHISTADKVLLCRTRTVVGRTSSVFSLPSLPPILLLLLVLPELPGSLPPLLSLGVAEDSSEEGVSFLLLPL